MKFHNCHHANVHVPYEATKLQVVEPCIVRLSFFSQANLDFFGLSKPTTLKPIEVAH